MSQSADSRGDGQFDGVGQYLEELCSVLGLTPKDVFLVPGNHDVHRDEVGSAELRKMLEEKPQEFGAQTKKRFGNYRALAKRFAEVSYIDSDDCSWCATVGTGEALKLFGWNTALLSATDVEGTGKDDNGKLQLHPKVAARFRNAVRENAGAGLVVVLMHHPPSWLKEPPDIGPRTLLLHGHTHTPAMRHRMSVDENTITSIAGAVRLNAPDEAGLERLGYNIGAVYNDSTCYRVDFWPRAFHKPPGRYYLDVVSVREPSRCVSFTWKHPDSNNPSNQHRLFWERALKGARGTADAPPIIWIAAHSAWHTFRPKADWAVELDSKLFANPSPPLSLDNLEGDIWRPLTQCLEHGTGTQFEFKVLLAHPFGVEAQCARRNQVVENESRDAHKDFFRTLSPSYSPEVG